MLLDCLRFPKYVVNSASLIVFCDASQRAYGFTAFIFQCGSANLVFSSSPLIKRTLPSLELLSVFLPVKCIPNILKVFPLETVKRIIVAVDTQVVLSWILSENIKTKCLFTWNHLKDIREKIGKLHDLGFDLMFKYVNTSDYLADLITRGITLGKFRSELQFWLTGPEWLIGENITWPSSYLNCLSPDSQMMVLTNTINISPVVQDVAPVRNFFPWQKFCHMYLDSCWLWRSH